MLEWLKRHAWKACKRLKRFGGSNPPLSAKVAASSQQTLAAAFFVLRRAERLPVCGEASAFAPHAYYIYGKYRACFDADMGYRQSLWRNCRKKKPHASKHLQFVSKHAGVFFMEKGSRFSSSYFPIRVKAVVGKFRRCVIVFCVSCVNAIQCNTCCNDYDQDEKQDFSVFSGLHFVLFCAKLWRGFLYAKLFGACCMKP